MQVVKSFVRFADFVEFPFRCRPYCGCAVRVRNDMDAVQVRLRSIARIEPQRKRLTLFT